MMLATTQPRFESGRQESRLIAPRHRRNTCPANRTPGRKTASGFFWRQCPKTRPANRSQVVGTHQENAVFFVTTALGCVVAPNNVASGAGVGPSSNDESHFNYSKAIVGGLNFVRAGTKVVGGVQQIATGLPIIVAGHATGTVTPWSLAAEAGGYFLVGNGAKDIIGGAFLGKRGIQQVGEALDAQSSWEWQNFLGLAPFGSYYDDPGELDGSWERIKERPVIEQIGEIFTGP